MFDIWNKKEPLAEKIYRGKNYKIIENPEYPENRCILYFSSNDIWFPNTEEAFRRSFVDHDYYEWTRHGARFGKKAIFFRDIYKSWYVEGISEEYPSINALLPFIRKETEGMEVVCVGSSAGGYMAALVASVIGAKYAISFSAQFDLTGEDALEKNPLLRKHQNEEEYRRYYELALLLEQTSTTIYYLFPCKNKIDFWQYKAVKEIANVKTIHFSSSHHGVPVMRGNVEKLLSLSKEKLDAVYEKYYAKKTNRFAFSIHLCGWKQTVVFTINELWRQIRKKLRGKVK